MYCAAAADFRQRQLRLFFQNDAGDARQDIVS
jgi:hypothetical protein